MAAGSPHGRFLLRGSALLIVLLAVWWFCLLNPLLFLLRGSAELFGGAVFGSPAGHLVTETPSGNWSLRIARDVEIPAASGAVRIHSIDFDMARADLVAFTFSLPVYWAIALAAPGIRRNARPLLAGTLLVAALEVALLLAFMEISARNVAAQLSQSQDGLLKWALRLGDYLVVNVIPFAGPFLIATALHRDLRQRALPSAS